MKKHYLYLFTILFLSSCQYEFDNKNAYSIGEAIEKGLVESDSTILKRIFIHQMDSLSNNSIENMNSAKLFFKSKKNIKRIKIDTSSTSFFGKKIEIYFKSGKDFYRTLSYYKVDSTKIIKPTDFYFANINEKCDEDKNAPYKPTYDINFKRISWVTDYSNKTFKSGEVYFENNSETDINYIKFRVILKNGKSRWSSETFFNQTVESYKPGYKGDITSAKIPGMENYFAGFTIKKENLFFDAELIEVLPKPESFWCKKLEDLKEEIIVNN